MVSRKVAQEIVTGLFKPPIWGRIDAEGKLHLQYGSQADEVLDVWRFCQTKHQADRLEVMLAFSHIRDVTENCLAMQDDPDKSRLALDLTPLEEVSQLDYQPGGKPIQRQMWSDQGWHLQLTSASPSESSSLMTLGAALSQPSWSEAVGHRSRIQLRLITI